jgi:hypothetical protein
MYGRFAGFPSAIFAGGRSHSASAQAPLAESGSGRHWVARARRQARFVYRGGAFNAYSHGVVCGAWDESLRQGDRLRWP